MLVWLTLHFCDFCGFRSVVQFLHLYHISTTVWQPSNLHTFTSSQHHLCWLKITSACLWSQLFVNLLQVPVSLFLTHLFGVPSPITSSSFDSPLCSSITPFLFHSRLKTYLFHKSFYIVSLLPLTAFTDYDPDRSLWATRFLFLFLFADFCARLSWPFCHRTKIYHLISYRYNSYII